MLDTATAEAAVEALLADMDTRRDSTVAGRQQARRDYAHELVSIMATLMRSGSVTGTVSTTGTAAAQTGTITTAKIS